MGGRMKSLLAGKRTRPEYLADSGTTAGNPVSCREDTRLSLRIGVIRNPASHHNINSEPEKIDLPHVIHVAPRGRPAIAQALADLARQKIELLVIDGGDGTVRDVLTEGLPIFGDRWPRLIVLPSGKTNALAIDLGVSKGLRLGEALYRAARAPVLIRRPIRVDRTDRQDQPLMGFLLGSGVFSTAIEAGQVAHRYGAFQSAAVAVTALAGMVQSMVGMANSRWRKTVPLEIAAGSEGAPAPQSRYGEPGRRYAFGISTLHNFPLGMQPFGGPSGTMDYLVWDQPLRRIIALAPPILRGWDPPFLRRLGLFRGSTDQMRVVLGSSFVLDGEAYPAGELRLTLGPEVQFLVP